MAELFSAASAFEESAAMREVIVANYKASLGPSLFGLSMVSPLR